MLEIFLIVAVVGGLVGLQIYKIKEYKNTSYYQITKNSRSTLRRDLGKNGEYLIYKNLQHFENSDTKFLFNIYIPRINYGTTEIDVAMICSKGVLVFESKNFSGWIFGSESQKDWTQTLPKSRGEIHKERFYNPIMQNASHIRHLRRLIGENIPVRSVIVFSDRCSLMNVTVTSPDIAITNRRGVASVVAKIREQENATSLSFTEINDIYNKLYPYTQVSDNLKSQHIKR